MVARGYEYDVARTAAHLVMREELVRVAMKYAGDFQDEISGELAEFDEIDYEALQRMPLRSSRRQPRRSSPCWAFCSTLISVLGSQPESQFAVQAASFRVCIPGGTEDIERRPTPMSCRPPTTTG